MQLYLLAITILATLTSTPVTASTIPCPRQPMPEAVEFRGPWEDNKVMDSITFAATPSLQVPTRAWVVRMHRFGPRDIKLNIVKLQSEPNCNRYRIERHWSVPITSAEYDRAIALIEPFVTPPDQLFTVKDRYRDDDEIAVDGTSLELQTQTLSWQVSRRLHESSADGGALSAVFHKIVAAHVAKVELPTQEWREPRSKSERR